MTNNTDGIDGAMEEAWREDFEKIAPGMAYFIEKDEEGFYKYEQSGWAWQIYKAARAKDAERIKKLENDYEILKEFWKPIIDKFETKYQNSGNANTLALTALTEAFDIHCKNEELEAKLKEASEVIGFYADTWEYSFDKDRVMIVRRLGSNDKFEERYERARQWQEKQ